jgi:hypothetical protein
LIEGFFGNMAGIASANKKAAIRLLFYAEDKSGKDQN